MSTKNTLKTAALLAALTALFAFVGSMLGGSMGIIAALVFALILNGAAYWFSDKLALRMAGAQRLKRIQAPELFATIEDLARRANVPMPRVYLIDDPSPNAFATGRNPSHAAIAVTAGLLDLLDSREVRGVLAHEFAHIKHRDILIASVAATIAGAITALAHVFQLAAIFGHGEDDEDGDGMLGALAMVVVAPLAATIIQLAVSRAREYAADTRGAEIGGDPLALASALRKLESGTWLRPMAVNPASAPLYIVHPFAGGGLLGLFQTHPPIAQRVARLEAMTPQQALSPSMAS